MNVPSIARMQVSEGYSTSFKKLFSCFYFKKQLLTDYQILSSICCLCGLPSESLLL